MLNTILLNIYRGLSHQLPLPPVLLPPPPAPRAACLPARNNTILFIRNVATFDKGMGPGQARPGRGYHHPSRCSILMKVFVFHLQILLPISLCVLCVSLSLQRTISYTGAALLLPLHTGNYAAHTHYVGQQRRGCRCRCCSC